MIKFGKPHSRALGPQIDRDCVNLLSKQIHSPAIAERSNRCITSRLASSYHTICRRLTCKSRGREISGKAQSSRQEACRQRQGTCPKSPRWWPNQSGTKNPIPVGWTSIEEVYPAFEEDGAAALSRTMNNEQEDLTCFSVDHGSAVSNNITIPPPPPSPQPSSTNPPPTLAPTRPHQPARNASRDPTQQNSPADRPPAASAHPYTPQPHPASP
jgi:hypothetical protein